MFATLMLLFIGCSAPHDNPLDPKSSHYRPTDTIPDEPDLNVRVFSIHLARPVIETWSVIAVVDGPDAPAMDSCWVNYDGRPRLPMSETPDEVWSTAIQASRSNLGTFIGQPFVFTARDSISYSFFTLGPAYLFRWLEDLPLIIEPDSNQITGPHPDLRWDPYAATFAISYSAFVLANTGNVDTVWEAAIPAGVTSLTLPDSLADGSYRWTLTVSDTFRNSCSREAEFVVAYPRLLGSRNSSSHP